MTEPHVWTVEIAGVPKKYKDINFDRSLTENPDQITLEIQYDTTINYFDPIVVKNNGVVEWYGYVEGKNPVWDENNRTLKITGRCRKAILWKKFCERFSSTKTTLGGFFSAVDASKLIYFLLRCPISDPPTTSDLSKIGWGIDPNNWGLTASGTHGGRLPEWVGLRYTGLGWRCNHYQTTGDWFKVDLGSAKDRVMGIFAEARPAYELEAQTIDLYVNDYIASSGWNLIGNDPYLYNSGAEPDELNKITTTTRNSTADFGFADLGGENTINGVALYLYQKNMGYAYMPVQIWIWKESISSWVYIGEFECDPLGTWETTIVNLTSLLNNINDLNNAKVRFIPHIETPIWDNWEVEITCAWLHVSYQAIAERFARNYIVETSPDNTTWTTQATKNNNIFRDIIESWSPADNVRYIRITLTADANYPWEISQIYIYQADAKKYCVLNEGSGDLLGPYLGTPSIDDFVGQITPLNIPFSRLTNAIQDAVNLCQEAYLPWEWWITHGDGIFHFSQRKGSDLSGSISFQTGQNLGSASDENTSLYSVTRCRYVGKSEAKLQDEISSDWRVDSTNESLLHTFYEAVESEKTISSKATADVLAQSEATVQGIPQENINIKVESDPYSPMAYDVGDDVTIIDSLLGKNEAHRILNINKHITVNGEEITLGLGYKWQDIANTIDKVRKQLLTVSLCGSTIEGWLAEGANQDKIDMSNVTGTWEKSAKNDDITPPASQSDTNWIITKSGSEDFICTTNWFMLKGSKVAGGGDFVSGYINDPSNIPFCKNPRFVCTFKIPTGGGATSWYEGDTFMIGMKTGYNMTDIGIFWEIVRSGSNYELFYGLIDASGVPTIIAATEGLEGETINIVEMQKYRLSAEVIWAVAPQTTSIVKFSFNNDLIGVIKFNTAETGTSVMYPLYCWLNTHNPDPVTCWAWIYIYNYRSEWDWIGSGCT